MPKPTQYVSALGLFRLVACLALCLAVGFVGSRATYPEITGWYASLAKPNWTPPNLAFPPVWAALYVMMAVSIWLLWERAAEGPAKFTAVVLFGVQLVLNAAWPPVFFVRARQRDVERDKPVRIEAEIAAEQLEQPGHKKRRQRSAARGSPRPARLRSRLEGDGDLRQPSGRSSASAGSDRRARGEKPAPTSPSSVVATATSAVKIRTRTSMSTSAMRGRPSASGSIKRRPA